MSHGHRKRPSDLSIPQASSTKRVCHGNLEVHEAYDVCSTGRGSIGDLKSVVEHTHDEILLGTESGVYMYNPTTERLVLLAGHSDEDGYADGLREEARFRGVFGLAVTHMGVILASDFRNHCVRMIMPSGFVNTLAGCGGLSGFADGVGANARFSFPWSLQVDNREQVYVTDSKNHCIRKITNICSGGGIVSTFAGKGAENGYVDGPGDCALFKRPIGLALDTTDSNLIVADSDNRLVRQVRLSDAHVSTLAGSVGGNGDTRLFLDGPLVDKGCAVGARFCMLRGVVVDHRNDIYVADCGNNAIRKISKSTGMVTTVLRDSADVLEASTLHGPNDLAIKHTGELMVLDSGNGGFISEFKLPVLTSTDTSGGDACRGLLRGFAKLWERSDLCDVTFIVEGKNVRAHRHVLAAQSDYFYTMLTTNIGSKEDSGPVIVLPSVSLKAFRVMLRYFYTHELPDSEDCGEGLGVGEMAKVADFYNVPVLWKRCVELFQLELTPENLMQRLVLAHDLHLDSFVAECFVFLRQNSREFASSGHASLAFLADRPELKHLFLKVVQVMTTALLGLKASVPTGGSRG